MSSNMREAHTAEHAFAGALQKILGQTLRVRKVEHDGKSGSNTAFIVLPQLDLAAVVKAEEMVNALIAEGHPVETRTYRSLEEARAQNPGLRANEERIAAAGEEVRVVEIRGHDVTACSMEHAANLRDCDFFLVTRLAKSGGEYEVDFVVGKHARAAAITLSTLVMQVCAELGANPNTLASTARKVRSEGEASSKKLKALSKQVLAGIKPAVGSAGGEIRQVYSGAFSGLADEALQEFAGKAIEEAPGTVVAISNEGADGSHFVFARSESLAGLDCKRVFREVAGPDGRGGGRPNFVTGVLKKEKAADIIARLAERVLHG